MRLIHKSTGKEVQIGDAVTSFRGEAATVSYVSKPHSPASTGRVGVDGGEFFPSVFDLEWVDREDR